MNKIATIAAIAALTALAACGQAESSAEVTASEAANTEAANDDVTVTEVGKPANEHVEATAPVTDSK